MKANHNFLAMTFGPIGDTLMILALFDDVLSVDPEAQITIISRRNIMLIRDLASNYQSIRVREIPGGLASIPFFISLLARRWNFLALGVAGVYSLRIKLFFLALSILPGNKTLGFDDQPNQQKSWLPLDVVLQFDGSIYMIDNFRRLLKYVFGEEIAQKLHGRAPHVSLALRQPRDFSLPGGGYVATNYFASGSVRSLPLWRWKRLTARIAEEFPRYKIVLLGGPTDVSSAEEIAKDVPSAVAMAGLPLGEAGWVIENAALYIGVDTGITHLAGVMQQKSLVLSHFRFPTWLPTYNPHARAIANSKRCECKQGGKCVTEDGGALFGRCTYDISDDFVIESVRLALSSPERHVPEFPGFFDENSALK